jgi:hypothetical protein
MRILLTERGSEELKALRVLEKARILELEQKKFLIDSPEKNKSSPTRQKFIFHSKPKILDVKQKKIILPKTVCDKYNHDSIEYTNNEQSHMDHSNSQMNTHLHSSITRSVDLPVIKDFYSLKEIVPTSALSEMKKKLKNEYETRKFNNNLRTSGKNIKEVIKDLEIKAEHPIKADKVNLIYYLKHKDDISNILIDNLATIKEDRLVRINKICQQVVERNEVEEVILRNKIQNKLSFRQKQAKEDFDKNLIKMESDVKEEERIINLNKKKPDDKEKYYYQHKEVTKYWDKFKVNLVFNRRQNNNTKEIITQKTTIETNLITDTTDSD